MSGEIEDLSGKLGIDTTDFKTGIAAANRELRVLETGFQAGAAALGDWSNKASGVELRVKSLTSQIDIQKLKVAALAAEHKRLVDANGANSRAAQDAEIKLNNETASLNKMQNELQKNETSLQTMGVASTESAAGVDTLAVSEEGMTLATEALDATVALLTAVLTAILAVLAAGAIAFVALAGAEYQAVKGLTELELQAAAAAREIYNLSQKTHISTNDLQEMTFAGDALGVSIDTISGAQSHLVRSMESAKNGSKAQVDAFHELGVSTVDVQGHLRNANDVFGDAIDALGRIKDPTEADAVAMALFGKSAQELNPLIAAGSGKMKQLADDAHRLGAVVDDDTITALAKFQGRLDGLKGGLQGVVTTLAGDFLPYFDQVASSAEDQLAGLAAAVDGSVGLEGTINKVGGWLLRASADFEQNAPGAIETMVGVVEKNLPTAINALMISLSRLIAGGMKAAPALLGLGLQVILQIGQGLVQNAPMLLNQGTQMLIQFFNQLTANLPGAEKITEQLIKELVDGLDHNLAPLMTAAIGLMMAIVTAIIQLMPVLIPLGARLIKTFGEALFSNRAQLAQLGGSLIAALVTGIVIAIPTVIWSLNNLLNFAFRALFNIIPSTIDFGVAFVQGIWQGIQSEWDYLMSQLTNMVNQLPAAIKKILGINSPSTVGIALGGYFSKGLGVGLFNELDKVQAQLNARMRALSPGLMSPAFAGGAGFGSVSNANNSTNIHIQNATFRGDEKPGSVRAAAQQQARRY